MASPMLGDLVASADPHPVVAQDVIDETGKRGGARRQAMTMPIIPQAQFTVVAEFPKHYFLENLAVRSNGSILVTALNKKELWYVPSPNDDLPVAPVLMHTFDLMTLCLVETDPDVFLIGTGTGELRLYRMDLRACSPGESIGPQLVLEFPEPKVGLNGGCLIAPDVLLIAGAANLIWRVEDDPCPLTAAPVTGTSRSRRRSGFTSSPANAVRASPTGPRSGRRARQQRSIRGQNRLCALGDPNKTTPGKLAAAPNPHRRPSLHRFSAGSFFGGFRTPALLPGLPLAPGRHPKPFP